ncbi:hypothetical protein NQ318_015427, partial [Aromia moschata]
DAASPLRGVGRRLEVPKSPLTANHHYKQLQNCRHQICNYVSFYPTNYIEDAVNNKALLDNMFGTVLNSTFDYFIRSRGQFGGADKATQLCATEGPTTYRPQAMRNSDSKWKFIVNIGDHVQAFTSEICEESFCSNLGLRCKQDYQYVYLLTYEEGRIEFDKFAIPTTCSCTCE